VVLLFYKTQTTWPGLLIVLAGVPVYFWWRPQKRLKVKAPAFASYGATRKAERSFASTRGAGSPIYRD